MDDRYVLISDLLPGVHEDLQSDSLHPEALQAVIRSLNGDVYQPPAAATDDFAGFGGHAPVRIPGTNWHVRLPGAARGLVQLAWAAYKAQQGTANPGDGIGFINGLERFKEAFQRLDVGKGERCVYLAIGRAKIRRGLFPGEYPTSEQVAAALSPAAQWCDPPCCFHRPDQGASVTAQAVREVLLSLQSRKVVRQRGDDCWSVRV